MIIRTIYLKKIEPFIGKPLIKVIAYLGLVAGILMLIPSTAGTLGIYFSLASLIPWTVWLILFSYRLLHRRRDHFCPAEPAIPSDMRLTAPIRPKLHRNQTRKFAETHPTINTWENTTSQNKNCHRK